jgi:pimeloyl-ACP methyl ester carboxylesterase
MAVLVRPDGARLYYERHGPGPDAAHSPIVLLEGIGGDIPGWRRNLPTLSRHHPVVALDSRGNGWSEAPDGPWTMDTFVQDAVALLDDVGAERAHLYGQSFGGMVALEMTLSRPSRVASAVLAATHAGLDLATRTGPDARVPKDRPWLALYAERFGEEHPDHVAEDLRAGRDLPRHPQARRRQHDAVRAWTAWTRLGEVRRPVLVLHGTADRVIPAENGRSLARAIPGARLVLLDGAGHVYHSERAAEADAAVLDFVEHVEASETGSVAAGG